MKMPWSCSAVLQERPLHRTGKNRRGLLSQDELTRISLLIGIFKALNILFSQGYVNQWTSQAKFIPVVTIPTRRRCGS